ncbi:hypothetical protein MVEN_01519500 [Mycena venus]|uniref:GDP-fucose protein O-fucosyltransferase 2 n=1 Tax=Mycena venus TaxID=2733690 RepID=A0A8H6XW30_9AGAR|nr:hypothetical protein MVEN_01519500 [Mycena venus]
MMDADPHTDNDRHEAWGPSARRGNVYQALTRRRLIWTARIALAAIACTALFAIWDSELSSRVQSQAIWPGRHNTTRTSDLLNQQPLALNPLDPLFSVNGLPAGSFRDNLRADTKYITSWGSGGWSNDVISIIASLCSPVFLPSHFMFNNFGDDHSPLPFGDVFDLPHLRKAIKRPVLEWRDVKASKSIVLDDIGCWNVWESIQYHDKAPRQSFAPWFLKLDISYTKTPDWIKMKKNFEHDRFSSFWALASLAFSSKRNTSLVPPLPSPKHNMSLAPDEHMLCYDFLYYVAAHQSHEIELDYSPAWRFVGQHMRWAIRLERLGKQYLRRTLDFIAVHVRHNDFKDWCEPGVTLEECFAPLSAFQRRVREVQDEIKERKGIEVKHVIMTSDEKNHTWWRDVDKLGWLGVDHTRTKELYGHWYPILLDTVIQSKAAGFVGTARSTVSVLATRRVQSWQGGPVRMVQWGKKDADAH